MAIKKTLLEIVQNILSDMDSEEVNSIDDTVEASQVAMIVETVFYDLISTREIPEHYGLLKLTALGDTDTPTHFLCPTNLKAFSGLWYKNSDGDYTVIEFKDPFEFIQRSDGIQEDYDSVSDINGGTELRIRNNVHPTYYTMFDDEYVVLNGYESTVEDTLQQNKVRAYGSTFPSFSRTDDYIPDIDAVMFPYLISEAKSTCFSVLKSTVDQKIEQRARRHKVYSQNDKYRNKRDNPWNAYGRT